MKGWNDVIKKVHSWDKKTRSRILKRCNPAEKEIIKHLETVEPNSIEGWSLVSSPDFKRLNKASFEYDERNQKKAEVKI